MKSYIWGHYRSTLHDYSDCKHASSLISRKCDLHSSHKHFLTPPSAMQRPAKSLRPGFLLVLEALLGHFITPTTCPDPLKSAPQASGQTSLSIKQVLVYESSFPKPKNGSPHLLLDSSRIPICTTADPPCNRVLLGSLAAADLTCRHNRFDFTSVCITTPPKLHKASIADHTCIL